MGKKHKDEPLLHGDELLREWGVEDRVDALRAAWGRDPDADRAIAAKLGRHLEAESAAVLVELEQQTTDKTRRKELRRSLFRLGQRGVPVPAVQEQPAPKLTLGTAPLEGYISASDGAGTLLAWLVKPRTGGVLHLFALINDPHGMQEVSLQVITRKALRAAQEDFAREHGIHVVRVDWRYCDWRMARAYEWAAAGGEAVSGDYLRLRSELIREPAVEVPHPILSEFDPRALRADTASLEAAAELLEEPEFRTWLLPEDVLRPHLDALRDATNSPLLLNKYQEEERVRDVIAAAGQVVFDGTVAASCARRLLDMAMVFHATRRPQRARQAVATALALEASGSGSRIPFCDTLLRLSLSIHAEAQAQSEAEERALIITPREARGAAARTRRES